MEDEEVPQQMAKNIFFWGEGLHDTGMTPAHACWLRNLERGVASGKKSSLVRGHCCMEMEPIVLILIAKVLGVRKHG